MLPALTCFIKPKGGTELAKLKVSDIIQLDVREKGNMRILLERVGEVPLLKGKALNVENIETALRKIEGRYPIMLAYIMKGPSDLKYYSFMIRLEGGEWLTTVYARDMLEGFSKTLLYVYSYIKSKGLQKREGGT